MYKVMQIGKGFVLKAYISVKRSYHSLKEFLNKSQKSPFCPLQLPPYKTMEDSGINVPIHPFIPAFFPSPSLPVSVLWHI